MTAIPFTPTHSDHFRAPSEWLPDPCVRVWFAPGASATEMAEHFGGPNGPAPTWVVRRALDRLNLRPQKVVAEPHHSAARCAWLVREFDGERLARIDGLDDDQVNRALIALHLAGIAPRDLLPAVTEATVAAAQAELTRRAAARVGFATRDQAGDAARVATPEPARQRRADARPAGPIQEALL